MIALFLTPIEADGAKADHPRRWIGSASVLDPDFSPGVRRFAPVHVIGQVREGVGGGLYEDENQRRGDQEPDVFAEAIREYYST